MLWYFESIVWNIPFKLYVDVPLWYWRVGVAQWSDQLLWTIIVVVYIYQHIFDIQSRFYYDLRFIETGYKILMAGSNIVKTFLEKSYKQYTIVIFNSRVVMTINLDS